MRSTMQIKSEKLFFKLLQIHHQMILNIFNMMNEPFDNRFLPIKVYTDKGEWQQILIWDNDKEILHGPFETTKIGIKPAYAINDYNWVNDELYIYFKNHVDACITGLATEDVKFEQC